MALSGVTDAYGKGSEYVDRMKACAKVITSMLRTWSGMSRAPASPGRRCVTDFIFPGLMYLCIQDKRAIRSLIDCLRMPLLETRVRLVHPNDHIQPA